MIDSPSTYGLADAKIIQWLIRAFYEELWAADTDAKRAKLAFVAKLGPLQGKAVAIVTNKHGSCSGYSPAIPPNVGGSSLFVYTPSAATAFRNKVMSPFFAAQGAAGWNEAQFQTKVGELFNTQLGATLAGLTPANQCSLISIDVTTVGEPNRGESSDSSIRTGNIVAGVIGGLVYLGLMIFLYRYYNSQKGTCHLFPTAAAQATTSKSERV